MATVSMFAAIGFAGLLAWHTIVPIAIEQLQALRTGTTSENRLPPMIGQLQSALRERFAFIGLGELDIMLELQHARMALSGAVLTFLVHDSLTLVIDLVMIPFLMFFLLRDGRRYQEIRHRARSQPLF